MTVNLGGKEDYSLKGTVVISPGWTKYDGYERKDKTLPNLKKGDKVNVDFHPEEKQTTPPRHYTIETLNNYLKNPFKDEKAPDDGSDEEEYKAIFKGLELGTEATRTGIIDNAKKSGYISLNKDVYKIERNGKFLIEQISDMNISMDKYKTSQMGQALKSVYRGEITVEKSVEMAKREIAEIFRFDPDEGSGFYGDEVGVCPFCGKPVVRGRYYYGCSGFKEGCEFKINLRILGTTIPKKEIGKVLSGEKSDEMNFIGKSGKPFSARLDLDEEKKLRFNFTPRRANGQSN